MWRHFIAGLQFLTIIPCGPIQPLDTQKALPLFPLCGLIIGGILLAIDQLASQLWAPSAVAVIDVVALAFLSGALHLDGLADTADGLYGQRPPEKALAIMKDSRIGAIGMVAVSCCLAVKWAGLSDLHTHRLYFLLLVPAFARAAVLFGIRLLPYGRPQGGTGHSFFQHPLKASDFWAVALLFILAIFLTGKGAIWIAIGFSVLVAGVLIYYRRKISCITGDMLGALIEITEAGLFLILSAA
ncbi:MAG: adenosylcobinamide-GDP ribazoletransferase [Desulfobacteraceae bacterium]|nr:adenosylcobinamide-GDP ribazoletransferase [Desulfobacteraceae bacterium]